jgi:membrane-bound inhibitor of C-type lysozyme
MNKFVCAALLVLCGCAGGVAVGGPADPPAGAPVAWRCDNGVSFSARMTEGGSAEVTAGGRVYYVRGVMSASGNRYKSGGVEYWAHGDEAMLSGAAGGPYENCRSQEN